MSGSASPYNNFIKIPQEKYYYQRNTSGGKQSSLLQQDTNLLKKAEEKKKKNNFFKTPLGIVTIMGTAGIVFALRGRKNGLTFKNRLSNFVEKMDDKLANAHDSNKVGFVAKACRSSIELSKKSAEFLQRGQNLIPWRDLKVEQIMNTMDKGFEKIGLKKFKPLTWICNSTRNLFQNITVRTHQSIHRSASTKITESMSELSSYLDAAIAKASGRDKNNLQQMQQSLFKNKNSWFARYESKFGHSAFQGRLSRFQQDIESLPEEARKLIGLKRGFEYNGYITDSLTAAKRTSIQEDLMSFRRKFSFNKKDVEDSVRRSSYSIREFLEPNDTETRSMLRELNERVVKYLDGETTSQGARDLQEKITLLKNRLDTKYTNSPTISALKQHVDSISNTIGRGDSMGEEQKILMEM